MIVDEGVEKVWKSSSNTDGRFLTITKRDRGSTVEYDCTVSTKVFIPKEWVSDDYPGVEGYICGFVANDMRKCVNDSLFERVMAVKLREGGAYGGDGS